MSNYRNGIDYVPLWEGTDDKRLIRLASEHSASVFCVWLYFNEEIYKREGYYYEYDNIDIEHLHNVYKLKPNKTRHILYDMAREGLFNYDLYSKYNVLTSTAIQERYQKAVDNRLKKRGEPMAIIKEYWLLPTKKTNAKIFVYADGTPIIENSEATANKSADTVKPTETQSNATSTAETPAPQKEAISKVKATTATTGITTAPAPTPQRVRPKSSTENKKVTAEELAIAREVMRWDNTGDSILTEIMQIAKNNGLKLDKKPDLIQSAIDMYFETKEINIAIFEQWCRGQGEHNKNNREQVTRHI